MGAVRPNLPIRRIREFVDTVPTNRRISTDWPIRGLFIKLVILVIVIFGVLVDSYWFGLRLGVPVGITKSQAHHRYHRNPAGINVYTPIYLWLPAGINVYTLIYLWLPAGIDVYTPIYLWLPSWWF
jgi:hypothetical protein